MRQVVWSMMLLSSGPSSLVTQWRLGKCLALLVQWKCCLPSRSTVAHSMGACYGTYLVQQVLDSGLTSARVDILARFAGFFQGLRKSPSYEVAVMAGLAGRDIRSTTGTNLKMLEENSGLDPWVYGSGRIKQELEKAEIVAVPPQDQWRVGYLARLFEERQLLHYWAIRKEKKGCQGLLTPYV